MPICANCNAPTDFSNSVDHNPPFANLWLCKKCVDKLGYVAIVKVPAGYHLQKDEVA